MPAGHAATPSEDGRPQDGERRRTAVSCTGIAVVADSARPVGHTPHLSSDTTA
ncbi:hypothetical protein [Streptomyces sp. DH10]|uniref:hypothetical protein n=1 Tax=Streptomyces sp. DH10 TaxID=3040121 RepID=UPI0024435445|nr:hypothetical protein [Streptomyces sp. DH10]MDG9714715.1 hypothetical protein [Streptomyces sp. DH10]